MMIYRSYLRKTGASFLMFLLVLISFSCKEQLENNGIKLEISPNANINDTIIVCKIEKIQDALNGSSKLVVDTIVLNNGKIDFFSDKIPDGTLLRFNFYPSKSKILTPGGIISKGSKSNFIFAFYDHKNLTKINIPGEDIQKYHLTSSNISNKEIFSSHKLFDLYRQREDSLIEKIVKSKSKSERDSLLNINRQILINAYSNCIDTLKINWNNFSSKESKAFVLHYFMSPFVNKENNADFLLKIINDLGNKKLNNTLVESAIEYFNKGKKEYDYVAINEYLETTYNIDLNEYKDKIIIISFWASWCKPCRLFNKFEFKELYNDKRSYCEIISISLDNDPGKWEKAEKEDNIKWNSVLDPNSSKSEIIKLLDIQSIPFEILIYPNKKIEKLKMHENILEKVNSFLKKN